MPAIVLAPVFTRVFTSALRVRALREELVSPRPRTNEISPAIYRWVGPRLKQKSEKRTTEEAGIESDSFNRPLHGLEFFINAAPSPERRDWAIIIRRLTRTDQLFAQSPYPQR